MDNKQKQVIAITIGDVAGIGPEIAIKALQEPNVYHLCHPVLIGDAQVIEFYVELFGIKTELNIIQDIESAKFCLGTIDVLSVENINLEHLVVGKDQAENGQAMLDYTDHALSLALKNKVDAVIGGPHTKKSVELAGIDFDGYPSYVAKYTQTDPAHTFLMLISDDIKVVNVTLHVSLRKALDLLNQDLIYRAIISANKTIQKLGISYPKIAVAGLNPHAGEDGMFGTEEIQFINPAIEQAQKDGIQADGAFGSDAMFANYAHDDYDVYIAMYHDQAHIPAKLNALNQISAMTIGTPVIFCTVGHGSAPDIAGKGVANPSSLIKTISRLSKREI